MSEAATGLFNTAPVFPRLVLDETLKRARVETSEGTAVRVTSAAADLTPITDALGTQQDPAETPTVIGLLKNLIANGGGGGGGSSTYPVMKTQLNYISFTIASAPPYTKKLSTCLSVWNDENTPATIPDWAKGMLIFRPGFGGWCLVHDRSGDGYGKFSYTMGSPTDATLTLESFSLTISPTDTNDWNIIVDDYSASNYYDLVDSTNNSYDALFKQYGYFWAYVIFFDPDPLEISGGGGGGGGEAISTYSLTLNNVTVTDITAPTEDPASSDDQTLVSLGYLKDLINSAHLQRRQVLVTGQTTALTTGTTYNLESTFSITFPSWTNKIRIGFSFGSSSSQNYVEFGTAGQSGMAYSVFSAESGSVFYAANFSYIHSTRSFTINSIGKGNSSGYSTYTGDRKFNIISITAYGNFSF